MGALATAATRARGHVVGVRPRSLHEREGTDLALPELHVVDTMHERKLLMSERADAFLALPGGPGTLKEILE
jgi:uncharacterized protein (TIGR00730 family)